MNKRKAPRAESYMDVELASKSTVKLGPDIKAKIGQQLRAMYSDVVNQGVPDRFSEILRRLDQADEVGAVEVGTDEAGTDRKNEDEGSNGSSK
jgi:Anti-sigma factor NepR